MRLSSTLPGQRVPAIAAISVEPRKRTIVMLPTSLADAERVAICDADAGIEAWLNEGGAGAAECHRESRQASPSPVA
jgi:hypothetical protein